MIQRVFKLFYNETSGLHEAAFLLASFALLSKVLALVRDRFLADTFGASINLDIYYVAFRIPDFIFFSLASLVASAVLIPFIVEKLQKKEDARQFFNSIFTLFFFTMAFVSVVVFFAMPTLSKLVAPGFNDAALFELVLLSRIMLLSPFLIGLSGLFASVTQSLRRFFVYAMSPVLYNVGIIFGIIVFYPLWGLQGLAYGVLLGALLHMLIQVPVLIRHGFFPRFSYNIDFQEIKNVFLLSLPRTVTLSAHHLTLLVLIAMASLMAEGSIAIFNLSFNLQSVPLSIIGVSYSIAAFPTLARLYSNGQKNAFVGQVLTATRHIIFWSLPMLVLFIVLRAQIVRVVLGTGEFGWTETRLTAAALALFAISIVAQSLMLILVRGYYAAGRTIKPLIVNLISLALVLVFAFGLVKFFGLFPFFQYFIESLLRVQDLAGTKLLMLPLAFSMGVLINAVLLWVLFKKDFNVPSHDVMMTLRQSFFASVIMGFVAHQALRVFDNVFDINTFIGIFSQGLLSGVLGIIAGIVVLKLIKNKEIKEIGKSLKHKFWKVRPIAPDQGEL